MGQKISKKLKNSSLENTNSFDFVFDDKDYSAKVIDVVDGDTVKVCIQLPFKSPHKYYWFRVRILGYDAAEMKYKKDVHRRDDLRQMALAAKNKLESLVLNKIVTISCRKFDHWGRILATIHVGKTDVTQEMLDSKLCIEYTSDKQEAMNKFLVLLDAK